VYNSNSLAEDDLQISTGTKCLQLH